MARPASRARPSPIRRTPFGAGARMVSPQARRVLGQRVNAFTGKVRERIIPKRPGMERREVFRPTEIAAKELVARRYRVNVLAPLEKEAMQILKRDSNLRKMVEELKRRLRTSRNPVEREQLIEKLNEISGQLLVRAAQSKGNYMLAKELERMQKPEE